MDALDHAVATAVLGLDTLWGGDVMNPSGLGRFIADSWFSDEPLPAAYTGAEAVRLRAAGGTSAKPEAVAAMDAYLAAVDVRGAIAHLRDEAGRGEGLRARYLEGLGFCFEVMLDLALEVAGKGEPVPYERCMRAILGRPGSPSEPADKRERVRELLAAAGFPSSDGPGLLAAVDAWRAARIVPKAEIPALSARLRRRSRCARGAKRRAAPPRGAGARPEGERHVPHDRERLVLRLDELPRACAQARRVAGVRGDLRAERVARDLPPRVRPAGEPRGRSRAT